MLKAPVLLKSQLAIRHEASRYAFKLSVLTPVGTANVPWNVSDVPLAPGIMDVLTQPALGCVFVTVPSAS